MSRREAARLFGIDHKTVSKILQHSVPPGYRRRKAPARPKLGPLIPIIDQILEEDKAWIKKCHIPDGSMAVVEQFWFEFVAVLHRLQGRLAAQG